MYSRFRELAALLLAIAAVGGCEREQRRFREPAGDNVTLSAPATDLKAGGQSPPPGAQAEPTAGRSPYDENAFEISEGQRLFEWFNCTGCHAHGGGAIGPPLMDGLWIYGGEPDQIYASIVQGRPNGMPSFGTRIPRQQVWQLVSYVRSLSGELRKDVEPGRRDSMQTRPAPAQTPEPRNTGATR